MLAYAERTQNQIADDNRAFCDSLKERELENEYVFLQNADVHAEFNLFDPFVDGKKIINQKWHVLISLLALLDTQQFVIETIIFDDEKKRTKLVYNDGTDSRWYTSKGMNDWIAHAVEASNSVNKHLNAK